LKNYYEMLSLTADAPADEIKKAFRREIARYHPDKVQHLGKEFQEMAAAIAADLTEAYRILMDPSLRAMYDGELHDDGGAPLPRQAAPPRAPAPPADEHRSSDARRSASAGHTAQRPTAGMDFVRRASLSKVREAVADVLGDSEPLHAAGFDLAVVTKPKKALFKKAEDGVTLLIKFVPAVDAQAVAEVWPAALRAKTPGSSLCAVLLMGPGMVEARDLAAAVTDQRRKSRGGGPVLVPVDVRDWEALFPPETPVAVRSLLERLKDAKR